MADKRYDQFPAGTPTASRIFLHADPTTGALEKSPISDITNLNPAYPSFMQMLQYLGMQIVAVTIPEMIMNATSSQHLSGNTLHACTIAVPAGTITGVVYNLTGAAVATSGGYNGFALYSIAGTAATLIANTTSTITCFQGTLNQLRTLAFASPVVVTAGAYLIAMYYAPAAPTTNPDIQAFNASPWGHNFWYNTVPSVDTHKILTGITSLQTTISIAAAVTSGTTIPLIGLY